MPDAQTVERIHALKPAATFDDVLEALVSLGGEAERAEIMDRALDIGGWSADELAVPTWWKQSAHPGHLRSLVDSAVSTWIERGTFVNVRRGRWRLANPIDGFREFGGAYRRPKRAEGQREPVVVEVDLNVLDRRTDQHMDLQDRLADALEARGVVPVSWEPPDPVYDVAFAAGPTIVVVEVKTLGVGNRDQQMRLALGQVADYAFRLGALYDRPVRGVVLVSEPPDAPWPEILASFGIGLLDGRALEGQLSALLDQLVD